MVSFVNGRENNKAILFSYRKNIASLPSLKKEVKDAHIGLKTVFLLVNLVIALRLEFGVRKRFLGTNRIAKSLISFSAPISSR